MKFLITEEEKQEIINNNKLDKNRILIHLRRNYPIYKLEDEEMAKLTGGNRIFVDDRTISIRENKKRLVNKIYNEIVDNFREYGDMLIRQAIKEYLDEAKNV